MNKAVFAYCPRCSKEDHRYSDSEYESCRRSSKVTGQVVKRISTLRIDFLGHAASPLAEAIDSAKLAINIAYSWGAKISINGRFRQTENRTTKVLTTVHQSNSFTL